LRQRIDLIIEGRRRESHELGDELVKP
jgi:hypothetical protein